METHPVPQNILDVEFKLFGSFTLKQFGKIVVGCMFGVLIFLLPVNVLIKFPLIGLSVAIGVLSAIIPTFQIWIMGFVKSLFISPRYVWIKDDVKSEIFNAKTSSTAEAKSVASSRNSKKINLEDIPLDQIFTTRKGVSASAVANDAQTQNDQTKQDNFGRIYNDFYNLNSKMPQQTSAVAVSSKQDEPTAKERIQQLQLNLQMLKKEDPKFSSKQEDIMAQINELRSQLTQEKYSQEVQNQKVQIPAEALATSNAQYVVGIVVNKKEEPVGNAQLSLVGQTSKIEYKAQTDANGRFSTPQKLPEDSYTVTISHQNYRFHTYKFNITAQKLPAYKFKAR